MIFISNYINKTFSLLAAIQEQNSLRTLEAAGILATAKQGDASVISVNSL